MAANQLSLDRVMRLFLQINKLTYRSLSEIQPPIEALVL
jgi:hypothetical protein